MGAQWLRGIVLDSRPKGRGFEPHRRHCVVSLSKNINPNLVSVQPRKIRPFITERLLMGRKESNQTNKTGWLYCIIFYALDKCIVFNKGGRSLILVTKIPEFEAEGSGPSLSAMAFSRV